MSLAKTLETTQQLLTQGRAQESIDYLHRALIEHPHSAALYNDLCVALGLLKHKGPAVAACQQALKFDPNMQLARNNLAWVSSLPESKP